MVERPPMERLGESWRYLNLITSSRFLGPNRIDVFARGTDDSLYHKWWNGNQWSDWESLGGTLTSAPAVSSRRSNQLDVFVRGTNQRLYKKTWNGSQWEEWEDLGAL
ncbi:hypothetical protein [Halobacillus shinanisalinarum]|uniref:hypothetical protein n=1 Tax=Halobacillus shinanisalinarum TaxID=2932258 RepID=UPI0037BE43BC